MCIFCKIVTKEIPAKIIYEDEEVLAILDISALTRGHTLVIPKAHYDNLVKTPTKLQGKLVTVATELAATLMEKLQALGCNIFTNVNEVAGQTVFHTHLHIVPRYSDDNFSIKGQRPQSSPEQLAEVYTTVTGN